MRALTLLRGASHIGRLSRRRRREGWKHYPGDARAICEAIVRDCWNGTHFQGSAGHFSQFWARDYGMCAPALARLGYREECRRSLEWALPIYARRRRVTTTIFPGEKAVDIYTQSSDSLPFLLHALRLLDLGDLAGRHRAFLEAEAHRYWRWVWDPHRGHVRADRHYSGAKDCVNRASSCYDNTMAGLLSRELDHLGLANPLRGVDFAGLLRGRFWNGRWFEDDLRHRGFLSADANIAPFLYGPIEDPGMLRSALGALRERGMDRPWPIRHTERRLPRQEKLVPRIFTPNYQGDTLWTQFGPMYISLLRRVDPPRARGHMEEYRRWIEHHRNYLELFHPDGTVYRGRIYHADEGMIWAALYLDLLRE
ncbi:MAG: hypothetical protein HY558_04985 [Euryarchaeota archaeon]|nr:hypothetical protein [Euryarchaeota archaeon]